MIVWVYKDTMQYSYLHDHEIFFVEKKFSIKSSQFFPIKMLDDQAKVSQVPKQYIKCQIFKSRIKI